MTYIELIPKEVLIGLAAIFGALWGSFANVCIARMPDNKSIIYPRSHCPKCAHIISWWENIPIFSFIILRGKCRQCHNTISWQYPLIECISAGLAMLMWMHLNHPLPFFLYFMCFAMPLIIITFIDIKHYIIPDILSIGGIPVGFIVYMIIHHDQGILQAAIDSGLGIAIGFGFLFLIAWGYEKLKKQEGLGGGDIKLMGMVGAFLGWKAVIACLFISSILGSVIGLTLMAILKKNSQFMIPFGPFIAVSAMIYFFVGEPALVWYMSLLAF